MLLADRVGGVGEGRRALVGGDDEIRVVAGRGAPRLAGGTTRVAVEIVGDRQQAGDEVDVGRGAGREDGVAAAARRQALREEAALGADRHDDGVLDLLRLDQAEHLGAVVLRRGPTSAGRRAPPGRSADARLRPRSRRRRSRATVAARAGRRPRANRA